MQIDWDVQTITAGDYTVELAISHESYNWFLANHYIPHDRSSGLSTGESLKQYLTRDIQTTLNNFLSVHEQEEGNNITEVKIADIVFAFNN